MPVWDPRGGGGVHVDQALTNISIDWPNDGLVGPVLFPTVGVKKQSDFYYVFGREAWGVDPGGDLRGPGTWANEIPGRKVSTQPYFAKEHALQIAVPDEERENADSPFNSDRDASELVTTKVLLGREVAMKTMVTTAANYPAASVVTLAGTTQFNDYVNSDPIGVVKARIRAQMAQFMPRPNVGIFPWEVMTQLEDHPDFIDRIKYSQPGILTQDLIGTLLGVPRIIVPGAGINNANPGQVDSLGFLWGKDIVLAYVPPSAGRGIPAFAYEFDWLYNGNKTSVVDRWREEGRASDLIRYRRRYDLRFVAIDANGKALGGQLIKNAVA